MQGKKIGTRVRLSDLICTSMSLVSFLPEFLGLSSKTKVMKKQIEMVPDIVVQLM